MVNRRGTLQVGKQDRQTGHRNLFHWPEHFTGKQIPKRLQRGHLRGSGGLVRPCRALQNNNLIIVRAIIERDGQRPGTQVFVGKVEAIRLDNNLDFRTGYFRLHQHTRSRYNATGCFSNLYERGATRDTWSPDTVIPVGHGHFTETSLIWCQNLLGNNMRRVLRASNTEYSVFDLFDRGIRMEVHLDAVVKIHFKVDIT